MTTCGDFGGQTKAGRPCTRPAEGLCYLHVGTGLTDKQRRFVEEYLVDLNATQAAIRAGYSDKAAAETGYENLRKPQIARAIEAAMEARSRRTLITADRVLEELARIGFSEMDEFATWGPGGITLRASEEMDEHAAACVSEISESTSQYGGSIKFKLHSKTKALELLGKHLALFTDRIEHMGGQRIEVTELVVEHPGENGRAPTVKTNGGPPNRVKAAARGNGR